MHTLFIHLFSAMNTLGIAALQHLVGRFAPSCLHVIGARGQQDILLYIHTSIYALFVHSLSFSHFLHPNAHPAKQ